MAETRKTAGEISKKLKEDTTKYDALEVGHALADDLPKQLRLCIENYKNIILEDEFCVVMVIAKDPLISNVLRRKFYCWPYLPKPRPNQSVFLYNKGVDDITKRLWVLPSDMVMAELHSLSSVHSKYQTMKNWSDAFYKGWKYIKNNEILGMNKPGGSFVNTMPTYFWDYIRKESNITMPSEHEYLLANKAQLLKACGDHVSTDDTDAFDFSKVYIKDVVNTEVASFNQDAV